MHFRTTIVTLLTGVIALSSALPSAQSDSRKSSEAQHSKGKHTGKEQCSDPIVRREWRHLSMHQRKDYLRAVKCMMAKPPKLGSYAEGITTRWEDFIWIHQSMMPMVHWVGHFLPWHRLFLYEYERVLREECGYAGGVPYWDQSKDYRDILASPLLNGEVSFGGNGKYDPDAPLSRLPTFPTFDYTGGGCIHSGAFKDEVIHLGHTNDSSYHERCLKRNIVREPAREWLKPSREVDVLKNPNYERFAVALEGNLDWNTDFGIHNAGHLCIEGDMADVFISPGDPLFYVFHANIDRIWWKWQQANPSARRFDVGNPIAPRVPLFADLYPNPPPGNVTLDFELTMGPLGGNRLTVETARVMDTRGTTPDEFEAGLLCYTYK
ncbi:hypothetical protein FPV67DRAFT_1461980 [Lyophyllum atratum]|nr:hypothetical protein FPV67DRAFT_1461980 [Lyophyllum atratum]